jgi:hypothetical protein
VEEPCCHIVDSLSGGSGVTQASPMDVRAQQELTDVGNSPVSKVRVKVCLLVSNGRRGRMSTVGKACTEYISPCVLLLSSSHDTERTVQEGVEGGISIGSERHVIDTGWEADDSM